MRYSIFKFRHFPSFWKHAKIIRIRKPGEEPALTMSYRPLRFLPVLEKLTEHIFLTRLQRFYTDIPQQFGFRPKHFMTHQQLRVVEYIHDAFDNSKNVEAIFLDAVMAFDKVWHSGLIFKINKLKFPNAYVQFLLSYLQIRLVTIRINDKYSTCCQINLGVLQGSK